MAVVYTGTGGIFTDIGKIIKYFNLYKSQPTDPTTGLDVDRGAIISTLHAGGQDLAIQGLTSAYQSWKLAYGIGDVSWVYSKVRHLKAITGRETILYCPAGDNPKRGGDLIELLPDVHWGGYVGDGDSWRVLSQSLPPSWPAKMGTWEFLAKPYPQNLAANLYLEQGGHLNGWLPWLPTDYHYAINIPQDCLREAAEIMRGKVGVVSGGVVNPMTSLGDRSPLNIAVYVSGRDKDAVVAGGWSLWDESTWADVLCRIAEWPECKGASFVVLGAEYDRDKSEAVASLVESRGHPVRRVIARPLGTALACLRACHYALCYPSGIGILCNVLRVPAVMLLPWCLGELAEAFADPCDLAARRYRAWPDPRPDELLDWLRRVGFPAVGLRQPTAQNAERIAPDPLIPSAG